MEGVLQGFRQFSFPLAHLMAEMAVAPLVSETAFKNNLIALCPSITGTTKNLWRETEISLAQSFPHTSLDELVLYRDLLWFGGKKKVPIYTNSQPKIALHKFFNHLAECQLDFQEAATKDAYSDSSNSRLLSQWLSFALPPELLELFELPHLSNPLNHALSHMLKDKGYAETHVHVNACFDFPFLWSAGIRRIAHLPVSELEQTFQSPGASFNEGTELGGWLIVCGLSRLIAARFLVEPSTSFDKYISTDISVPLSEIYGSAKLIRELIHAILASLSNGVLPERELLSDMQHLYRAWIYQIVETNPADHKELIAHIDPITHIDGIYNVANPEEVLIKKGLQYLDDSTTDTHIFETFFWQVLRIRCIAYRYIVQRPLTPGLQWFIRHFDRLDAFMDSVPSRTILQKAIHFSDLNGGLSSLEVRKSPGSREKINKLLKETWCEIQPQDEKEQRTIDAHDYCEEKPRVVSEKCEIGWVLHFARDRGEGFREGTLSSHGFHQAADPSMDINNGYRYGKYTLGRLAQASILAQTFVQYPASLTIIRGIDTCTDELGIPTWALVPVFDLVDQGVQIARQAYQQFFHEPAPRLHKTIHVGEDYVHLTTGLRRIYEAIHYYKLQPGDRLGHAVALGTNCDQWFESSQSIPLTLEARLFDLCWELITLQTTGSAELAGRYPYLRKQIIDLGNRIFGSSIKEQRGLPVELDDIIRFYQNLHTSQALKKQGFPITQESQYKFDWLKNNVDYDSMKTEDILLRLYLTDYKTYTCSQEIEIIPLLNSRWEKESTRFLQKHLATHIGKMGLTVEINPSSNLLVVDLSSLMYHPLWDLNSPHGVLSDEAISICVGSDDPITFATSISKEYQRLYDSQILAGITNYSALEWIDRVREAGLNARFTLPRHKCKDPFGWENPDYDSLALLSIA